MNPAQQNSRRLIRAAAIIDAAGMAAAPGAVLLEGDRIIAAGRPEQIGSLSGAIVEDLSTALVMPALVNTHAHLDLTHFGPQPFDGDFTKWVDRIRAGRGRSPFEIAESVRLGVRLSRAGGTAAIGDIAGVRSTVPTQTLRERERGMAGVSFLEVFGVGQTQRTAIEAMRMTVESMPALENGVRFGLQPHAPYSCGPEVYRAAAAFGLPLATHLAETPEEIEFVDGGGGPLAQMLKRIGVWDDSIKGFGEHPIEHALQLLGARPFIAAHLNYINDRHVEKLAHSSITVAYCPRASAYFGHPQQGHPPHRYRALLDAGINVALGTDSILCLDTPDRISVLDEMRMLHQRDGTDPLTLLRMATVNGATALGMRPALLTLTPGDSAGLLAQAFDSAPSNAHAALTRALNRNHPPRWVLGPVAGRDDWFNT